MHHIQAVHVDGAKLIHRLFAADLKRYPGLERMTLKVGADKAEGHRGQSIVAICSTTNPSMKPYSNSARESKLLCLYEGGGDDAESMCTYAPASIAAVQAVVDDGSVTIDGTQIPVDVKMGGDNKFQGDAKMLQSASGTFGCDKCECPTACFLETRPAELKKYAPRTLRGIEEMAHMIPGITCSGCRIQIVSTQAEADAINTAGGKMLGKKVSSTNPKAMVVCTGDPLTDPPKPWKSKTVNGEKWEWGPRHKSVKYGGDGWHLVWRAELGCWVTCFLHFKLRLTAIVFACCCLQWLDRGWKPSKAEQKAKVVDGPQTEQVTELVNCMLPGSKIPKLEKTSKLLDKQVRGKLRGLAVQSYNGPTCNVINQVCNSTKFLVYCFSSTMYMQSIHLSIHSSIHSSIHPHFSRSPMYSCKYPSRLRCVPPVVNYWFTKPHASEHGML